MRTNHQITNAQCSREYASNADLLLADEKPENDNDDHRGKDGSHCSALVQMAADDGAKWW